MPAGAFNQDFLPAARPGDVIEFAPLDGNDQHRVVAVAPLNEIALESGVTVADGTREKVELNELEMPDGHLAQYRLPRLTEELPDDVEIEIDHSGKQQPMYETKNVRGRLTNQTGVTYGDDPESADEVYEMYRPSFTELFVHETGAPNFTFINRSGGQVTVNLTFEGYSFRLERPASRASNPVVVPIESID
jgi:hypothetical protein